MKAPRIRASDPAPALGERRRVMMAYFDRYDAPTHRGVIDWVRQHDWALDARSVLELDPSRAASVDGILSTLHRPQTADWLRTLNCPVVRMHAPATPDLAAACRHIPAIECDYATAGHLGAEHLLTLGRPHFVFYQRGGGADCLAIRDSFVARLREAGHEPTIFDFLGDHPDYDRMRPTTMDIRTAWLVQRLSRLKPPLAVMTEDDRFAPDLIEAARILKWRVPTDVAVLGCDDNPLYLEVSAVPISSVDCNNRGVGYAAAGLLAKLISGQTPRAATTYVPARRVVARQSTATYSGAHPGVSSVLQQLRQEFRHQVSVEQLARDAKMSVSGLQHAFRQELGYTIRDELARLRIEAATRLLEKTDLKLDAVAADTNLGDAKNLCRVFAKVHGISPDAWRRRFREGA